MLDSVLSNDGLRCVDLFEDPNGGFGFEHFRSDPEDGGAWMPDGGFSATRYATVDDAIAVARKSVRWLRDGELG